MNGEPGSAQGADAAEDEPPGRVEEARKLIEEVQATDLTRAWSERAEALLAGLPAAPAVAAAAAPDAGADLKLNLPGAK